jgi:hypothetical protein
MYFMVFDYKFNNVLWKIIYFSSVTVLAVFFYHMDVLYSSAKCGSFSIL